jgi:RNA polymerase sigma-70 factor (ECF subfamily)
MLPKKYEHIESDNEPQDLSKDLEETNVFSNEYFYKTTLVELSLNGLDLAFRKVFLNVCNHVVRFIYFRELATDIFADTFTKFRRNTFIENISKSYRSYFYTSFRYQCYSVITHNFNCKSSLKNIYIALQTFKILHFNEFPKKLDLSILNFLQQAIKIFPLNRFEGQKYIKVAVKFEITLGGFAKLFSRVLSIIRKELNSEWLPITFPFFISKPIHA